MAKAAHLSFSPNFLMAFLLVLIVANTAYVRGACDRGNSVVVKSCARSNCDSLCRFHSNFIVGHTECSVGPFNTNVCFCCR
ncbi:hypothetical protein MKW92_050066 [Papaver armeniacum]|nr:hypothetical protein MKW92_050066 [Papaver armeniacum]